MTAPLSKKKPTPKTQAVALKLEAPKLYPPVQETPTQPETAQETPKTSAPEKGFSKEEAEEIKIDLGLDLDEDQKPTVLLNTGAEEPANQTASPPPAEGLEAQSDTFSEEDAACEVISLAARERKAKDLFYKGLCGGLAIVNGRMVKGTPFGPYKSLDLPAYGDMGKEASDQFFDRLCDAPFLKRMLLKLNDNALMEKYGAIMILSFTMYSGIKKEHVERIEQIELMATAATAVGEALEKIKKEEAAKKKTAKAAP